MNHDLKLGDRVVIKARVIPKKRWEKGASGWDGSYMSRRWVREEVMAQGVIAGVRTVFEGKSELVPDFGYVFTPERPIKTFLVAVNMREIWHVLPEDINEKAGMTGVYCHNECVHKGHNGYCALDEISIDDIGCLHEEYPAAEATREG